MQLTERLDYTQSSIKMAKPDIPKERPQRRDVPEIPDPMPQRLVPKPSEPIKTPPIPVPSR